MTINSVSSYSCEINTWSSANTSVYIVSYDYFLIEMPVLENFCYSLTMLYVINILNNIGNILHSDEDIPLFQFLMK